MAPRNKDKGKEKVGKEQKKSKGIASTDGKREEKRIKKFLEEAWKQYLSAVRDQGACACCWAIVICEALEALLASKTEDGAERIVLSPQHLINNVKNKNEKLKYDAKKCYFYRYKKALSWVKQNGICKEHVCPFQREGSAPCKHPMRKTEYFGQGLKYHEIPIGDEKQIEQLLEKKIPVMAVVRLYLDFFEYKDGIYMAEEPKFAPHLTRDEKKSHIKYIDSHAVLIVNIDKDEDGNKYFDIMNSWGTKWGRRGFGKIIRGGSKDRVEPIFMELYYLEI